ncbi:MAG: hypothetical protein M1324_01320 [Patescibacteria group bacterium]|nr:hypothetical protein [Patescibacteria group bacterium]
MEVSVPANTFTQNATVTVRLENPKERPANLEVGLIGREIEITSSAQPANPIVLTAGDQPEGQIRGLSALSIDHGIPYYLPIASINGAWEIVGEASKNQLGKIETILNPNKFIFDGMKSTLKVVLAKVLVTEPNPLEINLLLLSGSGEYNDNAVYLVHGILSDGKNMKSLGERLVQRGLYKSAWALRYDWRLGTEVVASHFGLLIGSSDVKADLIGHSRGVLICRYMLEVLGKARAPDKAIFICGPNQGSKHDTVLKLLNDLQEKFINTEGAYGFPLADSPALSELAQNSNIVQELSRYHKPKGIVDYYLFAADDDPYVSIESALGQNVGMEAFTAGSVTRRVLSGNHSSLVDSDNGIESLIENIRD